MNGYNIILDQNSGCVHSVDEATYDIITMYESHTKDEIKKYILEKYKNDEDVNENDIDLCFEDIEALKIIFKELGFSALNFTDSRSRYQFYYLRNLWADINTA